jgi:putative heme-binding domain-containing protein
LADAQPLVAEAVVNGLAKGWPKAQPAQLSAEAEQATVALFKKLSPAGQGQLVNLQARLGNKGLEKYAAEIIAALLEKATDEKVSDADRIAAVRQAVQFRGSDAAMLEKLLALVTPRVSPELSAGLIDAFSGSDSATLGPVLVDRMPELAPAARAAAVRVLLGRGDWTTALLNGFESRKALLSELTLDQKQALTAHPDKKLAARAKKLLASGGALPDANRQLVLDKLLPLTKQSGDVARGKQVFVKQCSKCHMHGGIGNKIGPDLTGMAVHPKAELLTNIIDPSRSVEGNYRAYSVITEDGRVLSGLLASETKTSIEVIDAEGKRFAIQREDIAQLVVSPKSIMPEGFEKQISEPEIADLLEFLAARGKYLPVPLDKAATVVTTKAMFHKGDNGPDRLIFDDWGAKTFHGVPFQLIDPRGDKLPNAILLYGPGGTLPPSMPKSVRAVCNAPAKAIHLLSGVGGWSYPASAKGSVSLIVRLHYEDGRSEDHPLRNGEQFADYIRHVDVPGSEFAFALRGQQLRYLAIQPQRPTPIREIEFVKGPDNTAPIIMAVTLESP